MSAIVLAVCAIVLVIAAFLLAFAWAICRGNGMPGAAGRGALIVASILLALAVLSIGSAFSDI